MQLQDSQSDGCGCGWQFELTAYFIKFLKIFIKFLRFFETSNVRLPLEITSVRRENSGKRVSDGSRRFISRRQKKKSAKKFGPKKSLFAFFIRILWIWRPMDLKISFLVKFCFRYTYYELCTTKNHFKQDRNSAPGPGPGPGLGPGPGPGPGPSPSPGPGPGLDLIRTCFR